MAYYPDVNSGEPFKPIAGLENELRHMVNARDGFRGKTPAASGVQRLTVPVYNSGADVLMNDIPVSFGGSDANFAEIGAVPVGKYVSGSRWGVLSAPLQPGEFGSCIVTGAVMVNYSGGGNPEFLSPLTSGFVSGSEVKCIYSSGGKAMIVLGADSASRDYITAVNNTDKTIRAKTFVTITFEHEFGSPSYFYIRPGFSDPCGFVLTECPPGESCKVQISGVVQGWYGNSPNFLKLQGQHRYYEDSGGVLLNSTGQSTYNNYFKVSAVEYKENGYISKIRIYDGGNYWNNSVAGETDVGPVEVTELEYTFSEGTEIYIHLNVEKHEDGTPYFTHTFKVDSFVSSREPVLLLAEISRENTVIQRWTGGKIYWRDRFVIPFGRRGSGYA